MTARLYPDMREDVYHADPCPEPSLSSSIARVLVDQCPLIAQRLHPKLGGKSRPPSATFDRGKLIHELLLGQPKAHEICEVTYRADHDLAGQVVTNYKTKDAQSWRDAVHARGKVPVLESELGGARYATEAIRQRLEAEGIVLSGQSEASILWQRETRNGTIWCRARLDHLIVDGQTARIIDLKTTGESAHPRACRAHVERDGYDIQAAAYMEAVAAWRPELAGRIGFAWAFAEANPPFAVCCPWPDGSMEELGRRRWEYACELWAWCLATGTWPGYGSPPIGATTRALEAAEELEDPPVVTTTPAPPPTEDFQDELAAIF